jgi:hypothetical protein
VVCVALTSGQWRCVVPSVPVARQGSLNTQSAFRFDLDGVGVTAHKGAVAWGEEAEQCGGVTAMQCGMNEGMQ